MVSLFSHRACVFCVFFLGILVSFPTRGESGRHPNLEMEWSGKTLGSGLASRGWQVSTMEVSEVEGGGAVLRVRGIVSGERSGLGKIFCEDQSFGLSPNGEFFLELPSSPHSGVLDLAWIGKTGEVSRFLIRYQPKPNAIEAKSAQEVLDPNQRSRLLIGTGVTSIWYNQNIFRLSDYESMVWTVKGAYHYALVPNKWDLGVAGYMNLFTVAENLNAQIRFFGANFRLGYVHGPIWKDWVFTFYGGWNYANMSAKTKSFGFQNAMGPQVVPTFQKAYRDGSLAAVYVKFAPIASGARILGLGNHEHAVGLNYSFLKWGHKVNMSLDYARLMLAFSNSFIDSRSLSFGIGLIY